MITSSLDELIDNPSTIVVRLLVSTPSFLEKYKSVSEFYRAFSNSNHSIGGMSNRTFVKRVLKGGCYLPFIHNGLSELIFILTLKPEKKTTLILTSIKLRFGKLIPRSNIEITDFSHPSNNDLREFLSLKGSMGLIQPIKETYFRKSKTNPS